MKAIRIRKTGGPGVLEYVDVDSPVPGKGQVIVRTKSISVNYADVMIRQGVYPVMPSLPAVLGLEGAGVVAWPGNPAAAPSGVLTDPPVVTKWGPEGSSSPAGVVQSRPAVVRAGPRRQRESPGVRRWKASRGF